MKTYSMKFHTKYLKWKEKIGENHEVVSDIVLDNIRYVFLLADVAPILKSPGDKMGLLECM